MTADIDAQGEYIAGDEDSRETKGAALGLETEASSGGKNRAALPRVLICCPIAGKKQYSINQWLEWISKQTYKNYEFAFCCNGIDKKELAEKCSQIEIVDAHSQVKKPTVLVLNGDENYSVIQKLTYAREMLRLFAVIDGFDYILFLDSDTIPSSLGAIDALIAQNKDCVSGLYFYKNSKQPVVIDIETFTNPSLEQMQKAAEDNACIEAWGYGFGCLLLSRKAFESNPFDYDVFGEERTDDFGYCHVLEQKGIKRWLYPRLLCYHLREKQNPSDPHGFKFEVEGGERK